MEGGGGGSRSVGPAVLDIHTWDGMGGAGPHLFVNRVHVDKRGWGPLVSFYFFQLLSPGLVVLFRAQVQLSPESLHNLYLMWGDLLVYLAEEADMVEWLHVDRSELRLCPPTVYLVAVSSGPPLPFPFSTLISSSSHVA